MQCSNFSLWVSFSTQLEDYSTHRLREACYKQRSASGSSADSITISHSKEILMLLLLLWWLLMALLPCGIRADAAEDGNVMHIEWPSRSAQMEIAWRSQRDFMSNVSVNQVPLIGLDLRRVLLNREWQRALNNNNTELLQVVAQTLAYGVQALLVDLEVQDSTTYLIQDTGILFSSFLDTIKQYLDSTDNNLAANLLVVLLRVVEDGNSSAKLPALDQDAGGLGTLIVNASRNISRLLDEQPGGSYIFTPHDLAAERAAGTTWDLFGTNNETGWPTLSNFLYTARKRVIVMEITENLNADESAYVFNNLALHFDYGNSTLGCPTSTQQLESVVSHSWRFLESNFTTSDISEYINCGYSPIIANTFTASNITSMFDLLDSGRLWSWGNSQPATIDKKSKDSLVAYNCAVLKYTASNFSTYWEVDNCYLERPGLCRYSYEPFNWMITDDVHSYFEFDSFSGSQCPDGYQFALPETPLEEAAVISYLRNKSFSDIKVWIDLNSISVSGCWVTGGPYATCPYQKAMSRRNFTRMLTPACICSFGLLVIVAYLNILRLPLHDNRKNWRKVINKVSSSEADGVPL